MFRPRTHAESRGLDDALQSHLLQGRFGRMFRHLPAAEFAATEEETLKILKDLAERMVLNSTPNDGPISAGYTYLGQFIDHDLTFDPVSSLDKQNDPDALEDFRTPRFDLDSVYGRGPNDEPYLYQDNGERMRLGVPLAGSVDRAGKVVQG